MRKTAVVCLAFFLAASLQASDGDKYFEKRNSYKDRQEAVKNIDLAIADYRADYEKFKSAASLAGLAKAVDFRFYFLDMGTREEKRDAFKAMIDNIEEFMNNNDPVPDIAYAGMVAWGRYGDNIDKIQAAMDGVADKVKFYGELLNKLDSTYFSHAADVGLGRLHYKAPNIIFVLTWPDKKKSRQYLESAIKDVPRHFTARFYLADTMWELGEKDEAKRIFLEVINDTPRKEFYHEDVFAQSECSKRAKELGIVSAVNN